MFLLSTYCKVKEAQFLDNKIAAVANICTSRLGDAKKALMSHNIPKYSGNCEEEFLNAMLTSKLHNKLTDCAAEVEDSIAVSEAICNNLGVEPDSFFPGGFEDAKNMIKDVRNAVCITTVLRILRSKAASQNSAGLLKNVSATMEFIVANSVEVPEDVAGRFKDLQKRLQDQTQSTKQKKK